MRRRILGGGDPPTPPGEPQDPSLSVAKAVPKLFVKPKAEPQDPLSAARVIPKLIVKPKVAPSLAERLREVREGPARQLELVTDELNAVLTDAGTCLTDLRIGVAAGVEMESDDAYDDEEIWLSFRKHEGKWALVIDRYRMSTQERVSTTPLLKASRALRMEAAGLLPDLVVSLIKRTSDEVKSVERCVQSVVALNAELREAKS
jgi:hypothetical protein